MSGKLCIKTESTAVADDILRKKWEKTLTFYGIPR